MKRGIKYILIFAIIGLVLGYWIGIVTFTQPECPGLECAINPNSWAFPGAIIGIIVGGMVGLVVGRIKTRKNKS